MCDIEKLNAHVENMDMTDLMNLQIQWCYVDEDKFHTDAWGEIDVEHLGKYWEPEERQQYQEWLDAAWEAHWEHQQKMNAGFLEVVAHVMGDENARPLSEVIKDM